MTRIDIYVRGFGSAPREHAVDALASVFELSRAEAEQMLSGLPCYVKLGLDQATARRCSRALRRAGAQVELRLHRRGDGEGGESGSGAASAPLAATRKRQRALLVATCAAVALASFAYVFVQVRQALREPTEKERIARRMMPQDASYFATARRPGFFTPYPAPDAACADRARGELRRAEELGMAWQLDAAAAAAERALALDPDCVTAAYIVLVASAKRGTHVGLRERFVGRADAEPGNGAAQLEAAYYHLQAGNPGDVLAYLERARKARPTQPMLELAFGHYVTHYADPLDYARGIEHYEREVARTGSLSALQNLIHVHGTIGDLEAAKRHCDRFYVVFPDSTLAPTANGCLWTVLRLGDRAAEPIYLERYFRARDLIASCRHGHLANMYAQIAGRTDDALREADLAIAQGCPGYGAWPKVAVLLRLRRHAEAARLARSAPMRGNFDRWLHAMALALAGERDAAQVVARGSMKTRHPAGGTTEEENLPALHLLRELLASGASHQVLEAAYHGDGLLDPAEHRSWAACGYLKYGLYDRGARALERALAARPHSPAAWACKVWWLELEERPEDAAAAGREALARGVVDSALENNLGLSYRQLGECERALPHFERARALNPMRVRAYGNLAACLRELGRDDEAAAVRRFVVYPEPEQIAWWWFAGLGLAAIALYLLIKLALIKLAPARFGHLRFP